MMWGFIIYMISYMVFCESHHVEASSPAMKVMIGSCVLVHMLWLIILIETLYCDEFHYLGNIKDSANINDFLERMKNLEPGILFTATCWHYEKKTRKVEKRDSKGRKVTKTESYHQKVVTHRDSQVFSFKFHDDVSSDTIDGINQQGITRVSLTRMVICGDVETSRQLQLEYANFISKNQYKDNHIDNSIEETFFETNEFGGTKETEFEKKVIVTSKSNGSVPWWMSKKWLLLSTTILMAWPYRWAFQCNTGKTKYESKKRIFINDPNTPNTSADPNNHIFDFEQSIPIKSYTSISTTSITKR